MTLFLFIRLLIYLILYHLSGLVLITVLLGFRHKENLQLLLEAGGVGLGMNCNSMRTRRQMYIDFRVLIRRA